jgi:hypothetical protein
VVGRRCRGVAAQDGAEPFAGIVLGAGLLDQVEGGAVVEVLGLAEG